MISRNLLALTLVICAIGSAYADTTLVDDDFESYADDNALWSVWEPRNGPGNAAPDFEDDGILTTDDVLFPGIEGQAVDHLGGSVMQNLGLTPTEPISPSATQSIHIQGDIYVGNDGNSRMSLGLRNRTSTENLLELGTWNASDVVNPFDGSAVAASTYAYRLILWSNGTQGGDLIQAPNWQYFQFDTALDIDDSDPATTEPTPDGVVSPVDIGAAWHTYSATITDTTITLEMDLYRDGLDNGATITAGSDVPGVDASITYEIAPTASGFDSLRIGSASGIGSANGVGFDNVSLTLIDVETGGGSDADGDGDVDGDDFLTLQRDNPAGIAQWQLDYPVPALNASVIPEPTSMTIALLAGLSVLASRRR